MSSYILVGIKGDDILWTKESITEERTKYNSDTGQPYTYRHPLGARYTSKYSKINEILQKRNEQWHKLQYYEISKIAAYLECRDISIGYEIFFGKIVSNQGSDESGEVKIEEINKAISEVNALFWELGIEADVKIYHLNEEYEREY